MRLAKPLAACGRLARRALAFVAGLTGTAALLSLFLVETIASDPAEKLRWLAEHGESCDVLFLGSSRIHHQLIPELFDRLMAAGGHPTRSFNLALDGLRPPEDSFLLERALRGRRAPLHWVILEANEMRFPLEGENDRTQRVVYWHDWARLGWLFRRFLTGKDPTLRNGWQRLGEMSHDVDDLLGHAWLGTLKGLHLGQGANLVQRLSGAEVREEESLPSSAWDGFRQERSGPMSANVAAEYERQYRRLLRRPARVDYADPASQALVQWAQARVAAAGGELVLLVPPTVREEKFLPDPARLPTPRCLDFADPARYPELFASEHRKDNAHLNNAGAEQLTRRVAEALLLGLSPRHAEQ
jgi:hypothetical protein